MDKELIIETWIEHHKEGAFGESTFWAWKELSRLVRNDPNCALDIVIEIEERTDDMSVLSNLAAGPLEELLVQHGSLLLNRIEEEIRNRASFKELFGGVWANGIDRDVSDRLKKILNS